MKKIIIYTDGGSRGNPGPAAAGFVFCNEKGQAIKRYGDFIGDNLTNNDAEYMAVILALKKFKAVFSKEMARNTDIEIRSDSELMVSQLNGEFKVENPKMRELFMDIWNLKMDFKSVKFKLIPREKNKEADRLVNESLNGMAKTKTLI